MIDQIIMDTSSILWAGRAARGGAGRPGAARPPSASSVWRGYPAQENVSRIEAKLEIVEFPRSDDLDHGVHKTAGTSFKYDFGSAILSCGGCPSHGFWCVSSVYF